MDERISGWPLSYQDYITDDLDVWQKEDVMDELFIGKNNWHSWCFYGEHLKYREFKRKLKPLLDLVKEHPFAIIEWSKMYSPHFKIFDWDTPGTQLVLYLPKDQKSKKIVSYIKLVFR